MPDGDYVGVLRAAPAADAPALTPGPLVTTAGEVVGEHEGFARYTIGQRRGLPGGCAEPRYVVEIRPGAPRGRDRHRGGARRAPGARWRSSTGSRDPLAPGDACEVQVRYRARGGRAPRSSGRTHGALDLALASPVARHHARASRACSIAG